MIWADRLGICLGILFLLWGVAADPTKREELAPIFLIGFVLAPWLLARLLHFLVTGRILPQRDQKPWRSDHRVNFRVGLLVLALAALAYWSSSMLVSGISLFAMLIFGYWLVSSAGRSSALSRGEIIEPEPKRPARSDLARG